jgi:tetratricopeptide (TPR) repeat protein/competence protein ComGC
MTKNNFLLLFFIFFSTFVWRNVAIAQEQALSDSLHTILQTTKEDTVKISALIELCRTQCKQAEYAAAKKYADDALLLAQKISYTNGIAAAYNQMGIVFWYVKDNTSALVYHQKALDIYLQSNNAVGVSEVLNRMGHDYADLPDYTKALLFFKRALQLDKDIGSVIGVVKNTDLIGFVNMKLENYPEALKQYFAALELGEKIKNRRSISAACHDIGEVYEKQNKLNDALKFALRGLELALQEGEKHLIDEAYNGLEKIYVKRKEFKNAYDMRLKYDEIEIFLRSADNAGKIKQMQMEYAFDKKQVSDSLKIIKEKEIGKIKLQKQKAFTYIGFAAVIISILFLIFVYRSYNRQRIVNQKLKKTQEQLIKSEKMAAFGVMASRVSHEIQNPLNFVNNFSDVANDLVDDIIASTDQKDRMENALSLKETLKKINEHGKRAETIVKQLEEHSNKGTAHEFFEDKD